MKKAAIHNPYWDSMGGGERYAAAFANLLLDEGWQVDVLWPTDISQEIFKRFAIDVSKANFSSKKNPNDYDLVFWISDGSIPYLKAKKTIIHFQIPFHDKKCGSLGNKIKARLYPAVCNSFFTKFFIDRTYWINSQVIHPPVNVNKFSPSHKKNQIISLARFSRRLHAKRQDILIQAFAKLKLTGWELMLAGGSDDPLYLQQLKFQAKNLPVRFIVDPDSKIITELLDGSKIFWSATGYGINVQKFPEKAEHFGITPVEAMAAGCVPIVTKAGGHLETITEGKTGYLWETIDQLNQKTKDLAKDIKLWEKLSQAAITSSRRFSTEEFRIKFKSLL